MKKLFFLDAAKAIATIFIVATHLNQVTHLFDYLYRINEHKLLHLCERIMYMVGHYGISVFIVASGFGLTYSLVHKTEFSWKQWYLSRFVRIYILFWCSYGLFLGGSFVLGHLGYIALPQISITEIITTFLGIQAYFGYWGGQINPIYWFNTLIISLYVVFPLLYILFLRSQAWKLLLMFILCLATSSFFIQYSVDLFRLVFVDRLFELSVGIALAHVYINQKESILRWYLGLPALFSVVTLFLLQYRSETSFATILAVLLSGPLLFFAAASLLPEFKNGSKNILKIGIEKLSYYSHSIYLFHLPFVSLYTVLALPKTIFIPLILCIILLVSIFFQYCIDRVLKK